jgi:hypothetical protein
MKVVGTPVAVEPLPEAMRNQNYMTVEGVGTITWARRIKMASVDHQDLFTLIVKHTDRVGVFQLAAR